MKKDFIRTDDHVIRIRSYGARILMSEKDRSLSVEIIDGDNLNISRKDHKIIIETISYETRQFIYT